MQDQATGSEQPSVARHAMPPLNEPRSFRYRQVAPPQRYRTNGAERNEQLAKALGWLSIGLGVTQLLAPRAVAKTIGLAERPMLMRAIGVREIAAGVGILSQRKPTPWLWTRVAGDVMDLALLNIAARRTSTRGERVRVSAASGLVAGIAVLDLLSSVQYTEHAGLDMEAWMAGPVHVDTEVTINRPPQECYRFWRDFSNLPRFMTHVDSVRIIDERRSHWKARMGHGASIEWESEITIDRPNELLAWRSLEGADLDNAGTVSFERAPGGRGTIVRVDMQYRPPGSKAAALLARLFRQAPSHQIAEDLRNLKRIMETGEIPTTVGQPTGQRSTINRLMFWKGAQG